MSRKRLTGAKVLEMIDDMSSEESSSDSAENDTSNSDDTELYDPSSDDAQEPSEPSEADTDEDDDVDDVTVGWQQMKPTHPPFQLHQFTVGNAGPQHSQEINSEIDFFKLFFDDKLMSDIAAETNRYAHEKLANVALRPHSIWRTWKDVTVDELSAYFGVILNMSLNDKCDVKHYFSHDWMDYMPFFSNVFKRDRFLQIHWMLHVSNPEHSTNSKGDKVHSVVSHMQSKLLENFIPSRDIAIDESTIGFKSFIQDV